MIATYWCYIIEAIRLQNLGACIASAATIAPRHADARLASYWQRLSYVSQHAVYRIFELLCLDAPHTSRRTAQLMTQLKGCRTQCDQRCCKYADCVEMPRIYVLSQLRRRPSDLVAPSAAAAQRQETWRKPRPRLSPMPSATCDWPACGDGDNPRLRPTSPSHGIWQAPAALSSLSVKSAAIIHCQATGWPLTRSFIMSRQSL
jgi:hypothetical protein